MTAFNSIVEALDELVPQFDGDGDWQEIVRRAEDPTTWRRRPRLVVGAIAFAVLLALLATPAFGVQGLVLHLLGRKNVSFHASPTAPNEVKKAFEDLTRATPISASFGARAAQARDAGTLVVAGHPRHVYVVPAKRGGFCWEIEESVGSCDVSAAMRTPRLSAFWVQKRHADSVVMRVQGDVTLRAATQITVRYVDGTTADVPFIWVSAPIGAGFFSFDVPVAHQQMATRVRSVTVEASDGRELDRERFEYIPSHRRIVPTRPVKPARLRPRETSVAPTAPLREATGGGFRVVVGANGAVRLNELGATPAIARLRGESVTYGCFRLTSEFGIFTVRSFGAQGLFEPHAAFVLRGVGRPVDGCEIGAGNGHLWPDQNGSHTPVEIPLTAKGRAYFANRAAARDLALFVHTKRVQQIRGEPPIQAIRDLQRVYRTALAKSAIRMSVENGDLVFRERSSTGRLFTVIVRHGKIARENVKPFAFVF